MSETVNSSLAGRFPALRRLRIGRRRRLRFVAQTAATDCGAACLAMTLGHLGREVSLEEVREFSGVSREGVDAGTLLETGRHFGLRGRGVKVDDLDDLRYLDPGSILHWRFSHFVVFERLDKRGAWVLDPSFGRRLVPRAELDRAFTGVALTFEPTEDFEPGGSRPAGAHRFLYRLLDQKGMMVRIVISSLLIQLFALAVPVLTGVLVDRVVPRGDQRLLTVLAIGCAALVTFQFLATLLRSHLLLYLRTRLDARLTLDFLEHLVDLPYLFFQQRTAGDLLMRLNSNSTIREILTSSALSAVLDGVMVSLYLVLLLVANLKIGLLVAALGALRVLLFVVTRRKQRDLMAQNLQTQAESQGYQVQMLHGIETLKASGAEHRAVERWSQLYVNELNVNLQSGRLDAFVNSTLDALAVGSPLLLLVVGANLVLSGGLTLGTMLALVALAAGFLAPLSTLVQNAVQLQRLGSYLDRINDVLEAPREQDRLGGGTRLRPAPLRGQVTLEEVSFRYGPLSPPAVQGVSIDIRPGQLVALVGSSGSGKSTLAGLLAGLLIPDQGDVMYDGVRLNDLDLRWLRSQLGYVAQNPSLFGMTVRGNLALADPSLPLRRVIEAAKLAAIHDDVAAFPLGYETPLADNGASLSGGQQQRLAIARALIHRPKVLILDEATSALDAVTEAKIQANLEALRSTRIVIAHRLSTVRHADQILVMDGGRVVERGTHSELLASDGLYSRLVAAQVEDESDSDLDTPDRPTPDPSGRLAQVPAPVS